MSQPFLSAKGIRLEELLPEAQLLDGSREVRVRSCSADSRCVQPGDVFVAVEGTQLDGHHFAKDAETRGAAAVVSERPIDGLTIPSYLVPDARNAFGRMCHILAGNPSQRLKVIGITGTNGKTTTSYLISGILAAAGHSTGVLGTLVYYDGVDVEPAPLTTPPAPALATWLARMEYNGCTHAVIEASSHALAQQRLDGMELDIACVCNARHDHLDFHGRQEDYHAAKARIFDYMRPEGIAVINADDAGSAAMINLVDGPGLTVGIDCGAEITATIIEQCSSEQLFLLQTECETVPVRTRLIGTHNIYNCLMAAAVGVSYGVDLHTIARGLEAVERVPGRLERIECGQPFSVFVDYAHTADGLTSVLQALRPTTSGRLICVFGAGGDRDRFKRPMMGRAVSRLADLSVVTSDNPRHENPEEIIDDVLGGYDRRKNPPQVLADREDAIRWALSAARPGDCVLIAGKGHEDYQIIGDQRRPFDDREVAKAWLYEGFTANEPYRSVA